MTRSGRPAVPHLNREMLVHGPFDDRFAGRAEKRVERDFLAGEVEE